MRCLIKVCGIRFVYDLFSAIEYNDNTIKIRPQNCDWDVYVSQVKDVKQELDNLAINGYADWSNYQSFNSFTYDTHYVTNPYSGGREMELQDAPEVDLDELFRE